MGKFSAGATKNEYFGEYEVAQVRYNFNDRSLTSLQVQMMVKARVLLQMFWLVRFDCEIHT